MTHENSRIALALHTIEIDGGGIDQGRTYQDKKSGLIKPLPGKQDGYVWQGGRYPIKIAVDIPDGAAPYKPGTYLMAGEMFGSGDYGRLTFAGTRNMFLIPIDVAAKALAAIAEEEAAPPASKVAAVK